MANQQPLKAGATFASVPTFADFQAKNPDFPTWAPVEKAEIANKFFAEKTQGFKPKELIEARQIFNQQYGKDLGSNLGTSVDVNANPTQTGSPLDALPGLFGGLATSGSYLTQPIEKLLNTGVPRYDVTKESAYLNNPAFKTGADIGNTAGNLAQYTIGSLAGLPGIAAVAANQNAQRVAGGEQNIGQGIFNTALDTGLGAIAPQAGGLLKAIGINAGVGALGGAAGYAGNQTLTGQKINPLEALEAAKRSALEGGVIGAGFHAAHPQPATPQIQAPLETPKGQALYKGYKLDYKAPAKRAETSVLDRKASGYAKELLELQRKGRTEEAAELKAKQPARMRDRINAQLKKVESADTIAKQRMQAANNRQKQRQALDKVIESGRKEDLKASIAKEKQLVSEQKEAIKAQQARQKELARVQTLKEKQSIKDAIALEKAEGKQRAAEIRRLRDDIKNRSNSNPTEENPLKGEIERTQSDEERNNLIDKAIETGKAVSFTHKAEKAGSRESSTFEKKNDLIYERGANEKGEFIRTINENGKTSFRYLEDIPSNIEISNLNHPFSYDRDGIFKKSGEKGRFRVLDSEGKEVINTPGEKLIKNSEAQSVLDRLKRGEKVTNREIMKLGELSESEFESGAKNLSQEQINKIGKDIGC